ncbi:MAG TPA: HD domain-containing protein [Pyrinomonadaceae bacterium]|nr:HD domain-containing protein [Chloracidobacterium sp.]HRJ89949.1 HD domain-containing protein [Pyrinomonadaceae bacterium]HRK51286.1 HD domain-containing protein [Pyrinomonadaceae bacterium]
MIHSIQHRQGPAGGTTLSERIYRDSVHNIIRVRTNTPEGALIVSLIDTPEFQRLRRVRQLGLAHFAYQGAEHSRFTHSLGAFHLATRLLEKLGISYALAPEDVTAVRLAALLHDIGHGAFSHVIESILHFHHEDFTVEAVLSDSTRVGQLLKAFDAGLPARIADIIRGTFRPMALSQLVSSQLDVDRMDYLLRDSLMTGVKYGVYDLEWIIKSIEINEAADQLYVSAPGIYAVEDYLQARYYMFRQVYFHRSLRAAEAVLQSLLRRALDLYAAGEAVWFVPGTPFERILNRESLSLDEHLALDDSDVLFHIKRWKASDDAVLADLAGRFIDRRLFKAFDLDMPEGERDGFVNAVRAIAEKQGLDPDHYVIEDKGGDVAHNFYIKDDAKPKDLIYVEDGFAHPQIREISEVSSAVRGLQKGYRIHRLCFADELKDKVSRLYHS